MRKRWSRKLAGCIVIEPALVAAGFAAEYRAGAAESGSARALVLEDAPRGLIFAQFCNEAAAPPQDARVCAAIERVLARVKQDGPPACPSEQSSNVRAALECTRRSLMPLTAPVRSRRSSLTRCCAPAAASECRPEPERYFSRRRAQHQQRCVGRRDC